jgi:hypothetical protein
MRLAMLGSPGVGGGGYRPNVPVIGTPFIVRGAGATYAAVVAGHKLQLRINNAPVTITFTGAENSENTFLATINAQRQGFLAEDSPTVPGQIELRSFAKGSFALIEILGSTDADVLASLGFFGATSIASFGAGLINKNYAAQATRYFGGTTGTPGVQSNQHAIAAIVGNRAIILMVDRQVPPTTSPDQTQVTPKPS